MSIRTTMPKRAFVFLGPPTSGKTTQAIFLTETTQGKLLRGRDILPELLGVYESSRTLIPDESFIPSLQKLLQREIAGTVIFDNIPRTREQAKVLMRWSKRSGIELHAVILSLTEEEVVRRALGRRVCPVCGESYHPEVKPPRRDGMCDHDKTRLIQRQGDSAELVRKAYHNYEQAECTLLDVLSKEGKLHHVLASGQVGDTARRMFVELSPFIFYKPRMAAGYYQLRDTLDTRSIRHIFISGMPVFLYEGRALMKDFDILVPDDSIDVLARDLGTKVGEKNSSVAYTKFADIAEGVEINSNLLVKASRLGIPFDFDFLWEEVRWVRFLALPCPIQGLEDLILLKAALGRLGPDDWGKRKDDSTDIEGLVGVQAVDWIKLRQRSQRLGMGERLVGKLAEVNVSPQW